MSILGQMIFEDGVEKGVVKIVTTMLRKNKTAEEIHEETDISMKQILKIQKSLETRNR